MKKIISLSVSLFLMLPLLAQNNTVKLSPLTKKYLKEYKENISLDPIPSGYNYRKSGSGIIYVGAVIKVSEQQIANDGLKAIGALIGTKAGNIWTVKVPSNKVEDFIQVSGITYIQLDEPIAPNMNIVRQMTRADSVHAGINLPKAYTGKDVVVGVIDFGFDYGHPAFYDTTGQNYRIKRVWELNTNGTPPTGYSYGNEMKTQTEMLAKGTDNDEQTHGTGVAGVAAGSGFGSPKNGLYRGMAFESDLVFVGVRRDSIEEQWMQGGFSDFIDGINYIFTYAKSVGKPAVVNISWGSQSGPHDGTSLFNQAVDNLSGAGKIVVMSAGNDGEDNIHLSKEFTASDTLIETFLDFKPTNYKRTWIDIWGDKGKTFCAQVKIYKDGAVNESTQMMCIDDQLHSFFLLAANGTDTCFVDFISSSSEFNDKPRMTVSIFNKSADTVSIAIKGDDGKIHAWNEYYYYGYKYKFKSIFSKYKKSWAIDGNTQSTTSDMGSAESVLLVGAYTSKTYFKDINGNNQFYTGYTSPGKLTPFSSHGPMVNGNIKPDITAPGLTLATACNSFDLAYTPTGSSSNNVLSSYVDTKTGKTYYYGEFIGTSASGPVAAGVVGLLLQAFPSMNPVEMKKFIFNSAIQDAYTGIIPAAGNNDWGHGKINAYGAVQLAVQKSGIYSFTNRNSLVKAYPNPAKDIVNFDLSNIPTATEIQIFDVNGKQVLKQNLLNNSSINISGLSKGFYLYKIISDDNTSSGKLILE